MDSVGGYELDREIGAGSTGTVWRALRQGPITQPVALKRLRAASGAVDVQRLRREAAVLAELDHPHIVRVVEILEDGDGVAIAMQFAAGGSLEALLAERHHLSAGEVAAVATPLATALASAHRQGTVHGDVKPANVLFTSDGEPLLGDFGSARSLGLLTSENLAATPEYVAPEVLDGAPPDERADIYSLGVVCYHAVAGEPPYTGPAPLAVVRAADAGNFVPLAERTDLPEHLAETVERAMARDPQRRFETADLFAHALRDAVPHSEVRLPGVAVSGWMPPDPESRGTRTFGPRPPRPERPPGSNRQWLSRTAVGILLAAGVVWLLRVPFGPDDSCPESVRPTVGPEAQVVVGDPDGEDCEVYGIYEPAPEGQDAEMIFRIHLEGEETQPIGLGEPGDQVLLGDWNCDGKDTLAHYLRRHGQMHYYDRWPTEDDPTLEPARREDVPADGEAELLPAPSDAECARVGVVETESGAPPDAGEPT